VLISIFFLRASPKIADYEPVIMPAFQPVRKKNEGNPQMLLLSSPLKFHVFPAAIYSLF
jgi:hypothetical protein